MSGPFFIGLTGLTSNSLGIRNVGNNLANSNTVGYKTTNLFFEELRAATTGGAEGGQGTMPGLVQQVWSQGNVQQSQVATDMSIRGAGFFVVGDGISAEFYTRAGAFTLNREGHLVNTTGMFVMGYPVNPVTGEVNTNSTLVPLNLQPGKVLPAVATSEVRFNTNLNTEALIGEQFSTTALIYDSMGASHPLTVTFTKTGPDTWDYEVSVPGENVSGGTAGTPEIIDTGTLTFDENGKLTGPAADITGISFIPANGADTLSINWDLYDVDGTCHLTQFNLPNSTSQTFQNGNGAGTLSEVLVRGDGVIEGIFSNGETAPLGQLALALFTSPQNLVRAGDNLYSRTTKSGEPTIGTPATGGRGRVQGNSLELSNVDIAEEFIKLILFQRAYQANSKMITTADQITREAIQMKQ